MGRKRSLKHEMSAKRAGLPPPIAAQRKTESTLRQVEQRQVSRDGHVPTISSPLIESLASRGASAASVLEALEYSARSNLLLASYLRAQLLPSPLLWVDPDSIDATPGDRARHLKKTISEVLRDTDPGDENADKRKWILWFFMYLIWWEGNRATARVQIGGGPGRGLCQIEPNTAMDGITFILKDPKKIENLGRACGFIYDSKDDRDGSKLRKLIEEFKKALEMFAKTVSKNNETAKADKSKKKDANRWPNDDENEDSPASIEGLIRRSDTFAIKLMRYIFMWREATESLLPDDKDIGGDPWKDEFKAHFARLWADYWKRSFPGKDKAAKDAAKKAAMDEFIEREKELDEALND